MKKFQDIRKILWAVDPFQHKAARYRTMAAAVRDYAESVNAKVELAFAYTQPRIPIKTKVLAELEKPFLTQIEDRLHSIAAFLHPVERSVTILTHHTRQVYVPATELLIEHARKAGADVIAVASHGRSGLKRLFLGSFAEDLLLDGRFPVFIVGSHIKREPGRKMTRLLVPVEFTPQCRKLVRWCAEYAREEKARLTLFHCATDVFAPLIQPAALALGGTYPFDARTYADLMSTQRAELDKWVSEIAKRKVSCDGVFYEGTGSVYEGICETAEKRKEDLIVMGSHQGAASAMLVGSVTRQVARHATVPVLAMHL